MKLHLFTNSEFGHGIGSLDYPLLKVEYEK